MLLQNCILSVRVYIFTGKNNQKSRHDKIHLEDAEKDAKILRHIYAGILLHPTPDYLINCHIKTCFQDSFKVASVWCSLRVSLSRPCWYDQSFTFIFLSSVISKAALRDPERLPRLQYIPSMLHRLPDLLRSNIWTLDVPITI